MKHCYSASMAKINWVFHDSFRPNKEKERLSLVELILFIVAHWAEDNKLLRKENTQVSSEPDGASSKIF